jgi:hypothetical protein
MEPIESGTLAGIGSFRCEACDFVVNLASDDELATCPHCGATSFARASLFGGARPGGPSPGVVDADHAAWLQEARAGIAQPGQYLAYEARDDTVAVVPLSDEWTRIGRSLAADVRFDDPTVSRRHALIVRQPDGVRVLDDRSLNGVFVNGERVEWSPLSDGDEIVVGCHRLRFIDVVSAPAEPSGDGRVAGVGS